MGLNSSRAVHICGQRAPCVRFASVSGSMVESVVVIMRWLAAVSATQLQDEHSIQWEHTNSSMGIDMKPRCVQCGEAYRAKENGEAEKPRRNPACSLESVLNTPPRSASCSRKLWQRTSVDWNQNCSERYGNSTAALCICCQRVVSIVVG